MGKITGFMEFQRLHEAGKYGLPSSPAAREPTQARANIATK